MQKLNLPVFRFRTIDQENGKSIFDIIRKKFVALTPEEWVRQHLIHLLVNHLNYPKSLINVESGLSYNNTKKRSDIRVLDRMGTPFLLIECKSPDVNIDDKVLQQVSVYNKTLRASYIALSNGLRHFVWKFENDNYVPLTDFPVYPD